MLVKATKRVNVCRLKLVHLRTVSCLILCDGLYAGVVGWYGKIDCKFGADVEQS